MPVQARALERLVAQQLVFLEMAKVQGTELIGQRVTFYGYSVPRNMQAPIEEKLIAYVPTELATASMPPDARSSFPIADRSSKPWTIC